MPSSRSPVACRYLTSAVVISQFTAVTGGAVSPPRKIVSTLQSRRREGPDIGMPVGSEPLEDRLRRGGIEAAKQVTMADLKDPLARNANLPDGRSGIDIAVRADKIIEVAPRIAATADTEIDATGRLVTPPFVDPHFHMDATLSLDRRLWNSSTSPTAMPV